MNYRHVYHAGNFADVVKHAVLTLVIERMKQKDAAFRVVDTHAGTGVYDLGGPEALKTGEWQGGIGRLVGPQAESLPDEVARLLEPYLAVVRSLNAPGAPLRYPGSPYIARALLRPQDRLVANELHPQDAIALRAELGRDRLTKVMELDGWTALKALLPPKERRGIVLVDPPFEKPGEHRRLVEAVREVVKRFATGVLLLWYPIKDAPAVSRFKRDLAALGLEKLIAVELTIRPRDEPTVLAGSGLIILNPPFGLDRQLETLLPFLARRLAVAPGGGWRVERLGSPDQGEHA
jgi:23S rRNA (adenine2030-N6)-methyltransferase